MYEKVLYLLIFSLVIFYLKRRYMVCYNSHNNVFAQKSITISKYPKHFSWQEIEPFVYKNITGIDIAPGIYSSPPIDQHRTSWCGCCYMVSVLQMIQDRCHVIIGKTFNNQIMNPWIRLDVQQFLNDYQSYKGPYTSKWNACRGGLPLSVMNAIQDGGCPLIFEHLKWVGFPQKDYIKKETNMKIKILESSRIIPTKSIRKVLVKEGPVVLSINAGILKNLDENGVVKDYKTSAVSNHAVSVVGWTQRSGHDCWILRNSWGKERVPKSLPDDLNCVTTESNICTVEWESWKGDPLNPGYVLLPMSYPPLNDDTDSPWFHAKIELGN